MSTGQIGVTRIRFVSELIRAIDALISEASVRWWFRGHTSSSWDLEPGVRRGYSRDQERFLANEFYVRARTRHVRCPDNDDVAGWLALMQHYGLPTRLLDWSNSSLVAAFFASEAYQPHSPEAGSRDACIWALAPKILNQEQGFEPLLYPLNAKQLDRVIRPALKGDDETDVVVAAMSVETDLRMLIQQGAFTVHASTVPLNKLDGCETWLRKFVIPAEALPGFAKELQLLGLRRGDLFPDLDNLARELRGRWPLARK